MTNSKPQLNKKRIIFSIDTSKQDTSIVRLTIDEKEVVIEEKFDFKKSQGILPLIEKLLLQEGVVLSEITEISVNVGPGSFTGVRIGVAVANTLGLVLQIPVNGNAVGKPVEPVYE